MSKYISGLTVIFNKPLHEDEAQITMDLIAQIKNVIDIVEIENNTVEDHLVEFRTKSEIRNKLYKFMQKELIT